ncbi:hypothetical protein [Sphingomonas sp. SRS2]|uniref:hypothetical protein n=1 Tax=Sphingomonas sp. SRS2 TaxID=133190 RepID=UPI000618449A|nr:hypothetical protein [Sphingomonas sp. SRS2]KKC24438.1 hypothetical protein WP12_19295 [Sphingomonas sp. SRS2]
MIVDERLRPVIRAIYEYVDDTNYAVDFVLAERRRTPAYLNAEAAAKIVASAVITVSRTAIRL